MEAKRLYKWVIVLLVLINGTLLYLYWSKPSPPEHRPYKRKSITIMLGMTGSDKQEVLKLEKVHFHRKDSLIRRGVQLHQELFRSFDNPKQDSADVSRVIDKIVENQREMEQMTFDHFKAISTYCNAEQKRKLKKGIYRVLQQMTPHPPGKRPHHP